MKIHGFNGATPPLRRNPGIGQSPIGKNRPVSEFEAGTTSAAPSNSTRVAANTFGDQITISKAAENRSAADRYPEIMKNINSGYYDSPEFIDKLADKLIEKLYLSGERD